MIVNKFPRTMWEHLNQDQRDPPRQRVIPRWEREVRCGKPLEEFEEAQGQFKGCGAMLTVVREDLFKGALGPSFMCPCCATENLVLTQFVEINTTFPEKADWLLKRRQDIVRLLLTDKELHGADLYNDDVVTFIEGLGITIPDDTNAIVKEIQAPKFE